MRDTFNMVADLRDFHEKFGLPRPTRPASLAPDTAVFRIKFLQEELDEYKRGVQEGDLAQQFDALIDLVYVALGTADLQGFPWAEGWNEVQRANMSKERAGTAERSKRGFALDIVKPAGWRKPDIEGVLEAASGS